MPQITSESVSAAEGIKVVRLRVPAGAVVPAHHSNVDVVVTIVSGQGDFTVGGQVRPVRAGDVVVMRPKERHAIAATTDLELVVVHARVTASGEPPACGSG